MPRTLFEHLSPDTGAKRILALDGGGVKGVLTLGMLKPLEAELRRRAGGDSAFRLSDYYDLIGGTSTGAIIASGLALGLSVDELTDFYMRIGPEVFGRIAGDGVVIRPRFDVARLRRALQGVFGAKTLGTEDLKTGLAIYAKRLDDGAAWVATNHPLGAHYDAPDGSGVYPHKRYRLADLVLASTSPSYIDEVAIDVDFDERRKPLRKGYFVDGAISANNNPSVQMLLLALDPAHRFGWKPGADVLMMTSLGAGCRRPRVAGEVFQELPPAMRAMHTLRAVVHDSEMLGVTLLQAVSAPSKPWPVNPDIAEHNGPSLSAAPLLNYQRIDVALDRKPRASRRSDPTPPMTHLERLIGRELSAEIMEQLDHPTNGHQRNMALLHEIGAAAGRTFAGEAYPDPRFDLAGWRAET
jgi:uncharacterized protein